MSEPTSDRLARIEAKLDRVLEEHGKTKEIICN